MSRFRISLGGCLLLFGCTQSAPSPQGKSTTVTTTQRASVSASQRIVTQFARGQALLRIGEWNASEAPLNLHARAWGCADQTQELAPGEPERANTGGSRITFVEAGGDLLEWYEDRSGSVEQGFTVSKLPRCVAAGSPLVLELETSQGWTNAVSADALQATFRHRLGANVRYTDASARDAHGRLYPVRIVRRGESVGLEVDAHDAALPLVIDPLAWTEQQKLVLADGAANDNFGNAVAISGNYLAVGAFFDDDKASNAGVVHVFNRVGAGWNATPQKLIASDGAADDNLGFSVANNGTFVAAGANLDDDGGNASGSVYVFSQTGANWVNQKKIVASDAQAGDQFGSAVALDGTTLVIGANYRGEQAAAAGAAYVYVWNGTNWVFQQKLLPTAAEADANDIFGTSVAISGNTAVVGAPYDSDTVSFAGAAYVFVRNGTTWTEQAKLVASDATANAYAGQSVGISGDSIVVGAYNDKEKGATAGAAYVWTRSGTTWTKQQKVFASDAAAQAQLGWAVDLKGDVMVAGAYNDSSGKGATYVFTRTGTVWTQSTKLVASDAATGAGVGFSVSLDGNNVASGAPAAKVGNNAAQGEAYVATLTNGSACNVASDCKSGFCSENVCCATACSGVCQTCLGSRKGSGADGVCGNVAADTDPRDSCATNPATSCGSSGMCNGAGACQLYPNGTGCTTAVCPTPTSANPADTCNGLGTCMPTAVVQCQRGYQCAAGACNTSCTSDGDCDATLGFECDLASHKCKVPQAGACQADLDCGTGHCADGVCCDTKCADKCTSCLAVHKGSGVDGVCGVISADTDPKDECPVAADPNDVCGADGLCDGQGSCRSFQKPTTPCGATACDAATNSISGFICDGGGKCGNTPTGCAPFLCSGDSCSKTCKSDKDCADGAFCNGSSICTEKAADGASCAAKNECASNFCVDGVCCAEACDGQCEACAEKSAKGKCVAVLGNPRGARPACDEAPAGEPCREAHCSGNDEERTSCAGYVSSEITCQDPGCQDGLQTGTGRCNGKGMCAVDAPVECGAYKCGATECLTACETDADCTEGNRCTDQKCGSGARCSDDLTSVLDADGNATSCAPLLCQGQACLKACSVSTDCADGYVCNSDNQQCEASTITAPTDSSGCGCRAAGGRGSRLPPLVGVAVLALWCARRRRRTA